jgi:phosphoribosyl 1,2-cyclic phosphate phosphodiesterase
LEEALNFIALVKPDKAFAYKSPLGFHEEVQKQLPPNVFLAFDNLEITL